MQVHAQINAVKIIFPSIAIKLKVAQTRRSLAKDHGYFD
jgi:hypothetical protein